MPNLAILPSRRPGLPRTKGVPFQFVPIPQNFLAFWVQRLPRTQIVIYQYICMRTLGFRKPIDAISLSQFTSGVQNGDGKWLDKGTGLSRRTILRALNSLQSLGLVRRITHPGRPTAYEPLAPLPLDDQCQHRGTPTRATLLALPPVPK